MTRRRSLETELTVWIAGSLLVLYGIIATAVWFASSRSQMQFALLTVKSEAEAVAMFVAARGRLTAPELGEVEEAPFPIWVRVLDGETILAATPGAPPLPIASHDESGEVVSVREGKNARSYLIFRHAIGGRTARLGENLAVEAIGSVDLLERANRRMGWGLTLFGLVVIPIASAGGRMLARRALRPVTGLVDEIRALDASNPGRRLTTASSAVDEVAVLAEAFNGELGRLELTLAAMRRFTEDASHEIRNPLAVLRTGIEVALRRERSAESYRALLVENLREIDRLQSILDGLLTLARAEPDGALPVQRSRLDLARLIAETAARFSTVAEERGARIDLFVSGPLPIEGDDRLLRLVFFNLLDNALKHGPDHEPVRVDAAAEGGQIVVRVSDRGKGIAPEARSQIFERYFRRETSASVNVGGLGLSVVRWATEANEGSVALVPTESGTTFEVRLPAARPDSETKG